VYIVQGRKLDGNIGSSVSNPEGYMQFTRGLHYLANPDRHAPAMGDRAHAR